MCDVDCTDSAVAWAAGFFDCVGIVAVSKDRQWIGVRHTCRAALEEFRQRWGGEIVGTRWSLNAGDALKFLEDVRPYLLIRAEQAYRYASFFCDPDMEAEVVAWFDSPPAPVAIDKKGRTFSVA